MGYLEVPREWESSTFDFHRSKGIVWVCDLARSSSYLNDNAFRGSSGNILAPTSFHITRGGSSRRWSFIKWTGDGFVAWF